MFRLLGYKICILCMNQLDNKVWNRKKGFLNSMSLFFRCVGLLAFFLMFQQAQALTFSLPRDGSSVIGDVQWTYVGANEDITDLGQRFDVGYLEFNEANPGVNLSNLYFRQPLRVPTRFILPDAPRQGIVINVAELRLYYYLPGGHEVMTFPVGIGRENAVTPLVKTKIIEKKQDPVWIPTAATRAEAVEKGIMLPAVIEAGPDNPLGAYAMRMGISSYLIHGTNDPSGVGIRSSAGCIRMYPDDIKELFSQVSVGTPVNIVDQPDKIGWDGKFLELESHVPLNHKQGRSEREANEVIPLITPHIKKYHAEIFWDRAISVASHQLGIPEKIGARQAF